MSFFLIVSNLEISCGVSNETYLTEIELIIVGGPSSI